MREVLGMVVVLALICLVAAVALSQVYRVTKDPIAQAKEAEAREAAAQVLQPLLAAGAVIEKRENLAGKEALYLAMAAGKIRGAAFIVRNDSGYSGLIECMLGVDMTGNITGFAVVQHAETPGLGANAASNEEWQAQLIAADGEPRNLGNTDWRVKKYGGDIDALTGATITPRAIVAAIREGLEWFRDHQSELTGAGEMAEAAAVEGGATDKNLQTSKPFPEAEATPASITSQELAE